MSEWRDAADAAVVVEDEVLGCVVDGLPVALFRVEGEVFALHDLCSHGHARLSEGFVEDGCVECPLHQGLVDIRTGAARTAPISEPVRSIPAREVGGRIEVRI
ncbi:anthranilate 1,2-dioxygenase ferredoxin subunit AndAb [Muricoccus vinaceus]|uniref:Anthranilate 1,2-dioxygenase ferredoxin subunit AndAb n=1 Tax=Muricoccus vinaceus TaxID=424704 RepID=A0ABV6IP61_9PROT